MFVFVFVCMCAHSLTLPVMDLSPANEMTFILLSFSHCLPVCLSVCLCVRARAHPLTVPVMGPEPSQWKWQVEDIVFHRSFLLQRFSRSRSSFWLVHWSIYQGTSIDQVKNLNEALFIFLCFCGWGGPWKSRRELVGPNNRHEVELHCGERQEIVGWVHTCKVPKRNKYVSLGPWNLLLAMHYDFLSCTVERLRRQIRSLSQWWNAKCDINYFRVTDVHFHFNCRMKLFHIYLKYQWNRNCFIQIRFV